MGSYRDPETHPGFYNIAVSESDVARCFWRFFSPPRFFFRTSSSLSSCSLSRRLPRHISLQSTSIITIRLAFDSAILQLPFHVEIQTGSPRPAAFRDPVFLSHRSATFSHRPSTTLRERHLGPVADGSGQCWRCGDGPLLYRRAIGGYCVSHVHNILLSTSPALPIAPPSLKFGQRKHRRARRQSRNVTPGVVMAMGTG